MGIGILQLASYSNIDAYLTLKPKITYFKNVYERHTSFSSRISKQTFINKLDFSTKSSADISKNESLLGKITLIIDLPEIPIFKLLSGDIDEVSKFSWARNIGFRIINNIELIIDNKIIDKQYGELMKLQYDLTTTKNIDEIIGNVHELTTPTNGKKKYRLSIPLSFWFTKKSKSYLPLISLHNNPIKLHVELNSVDKCHIISPSNYILIDDDIVNFSKGEYIIQTINGIQAIGKFECFDIITRKLYYLKINNVQFSSLTISNPLLIQNEGDKDLLLYAENSDGTLLNEKYLIIGQTSKTYVMPQINTMETKFKPNLFNQDNIKIDNAYLLVEHITLNSKEREIFKRTEIDCHIEQTIFSGEQIIDGINQIIPLNFTRPCKEILWISQLAQTQNTRINQWDNYTNNYLTDDNGNYIGDNLITQSSILYYGNERVTFRDSKYYDTLAVNTYHTYSNKIKNGINICSFCLNPENSTQPSGSANLSVIENVSLRLRNESAEKIIVRVYAVVYNTLRFKNGTANLIFSGDIIL